MTKYNERIIEVIRKESKKTGNYMDYKRTEYLANEYTTWQRKVESEYKRIIQEKIKNGC